MLLALSLGCLSQMLTFSRIDLLEFYEAMGYSDQMLQSIQKMDWMNGSLMSGMSLIYSIPALVYLLWIKQYFEKQNKGEKDD